MLRHYKLAVAIAGAATAWGCDDPVGGIPTTSDGGAGGETTSATGGDGGNGGSGGSAGAPVTTTGGAPPAYMGSIEGSVASADGTPLVDAPIQLCADVCILGFSDNGGGWRYDGVAPLTWKLDIRHPMDATGVYAPVLFGAVIGPDEQVVIDATAFVPQMGARFPLTAGVSTTSVDATLDITIDTAGLELPLGVTDPFIAGARIAEDRFPPLVTTDDSQPLPGTIHTMWAFMPHGSSAPGGMPLTIANDLGLAPDTALELYTLDDKTGFYTLDSTAQVSADAMTIDGGAITRLTWLAVVEP